MIGRDKEKQELMDAYQSDYSEFVAIYGRRRIGKTFLVDETFSGRITFKHAGLSPEDEEAKGLLQAQLEHFYNSLVLHGMEPCEKPGYWLKAFFCWKSTCRK